MGINREWHLKNKMPKNATPEQRLRWHLGHQKHCACRKMPEKMLEKMKKDVKERLCAGESRFIKIIRQ